MPQDEALDPETPWEAVAAAKEAGNAALRSADLPLATEHYERAIGLYEEALAQAPQPKILRNNDLVRYSEGRYARIDTAHPQFGDYVLEDLGTRDLVKLKVGRYEEVSKRFVRKELLWVPQELFDLHLACLQNLALVALKLARASKSRGDLEEAVARADAALSLDGRAAKALMRKGAALLELRDVPGATRVLALAAQETRGRDPEVTRLLELALEAKGKGKGKGKSKGGKAQAQAQAQAQARAEAAAAEAEGDDSSSSSSEGAGDSCGPSCGSCAAGSDSRGSTAAAAAAGSSPRGSGELWGPSNGVQEGNQGCTPAPQPARGRLIATPSKVAIAVATLVTAIVGSLALLFRSHQRETSDAEVEL